MSANDNNEEQNTNGTFDDAPIGLVEDLNIIIKNLSSIENSLRQLRNQAQNSNEVSLSYYLEMATQIAGERLHNAKTQKRWLSEEE